MKSKRDVAEKTLSQLVADHMPKALLYEAIEEGVRASLSEFKFDPWEFKKIVQEVVENRVKELLATTFKPDIEKLAMMSAQKIVEKLSTR